MVKSGRAEDESYMDYDKDLGMIKLTYYSEELDREVEVTITGDTSEYDVEDYKIKKCIFTGEVIDDYIVDVIDD